MVKLLPFFHTYFREKQRLLLLVCLFCSGIADGKTLYVNDLSKQGDVFTTAVGDNANDGLSPNQPKLTFSAAFKNAVEGDTIYVDIGIYEDIDYLQEVYKNSKKIKIILAFDFNTTVEKIPLPTTQKTAPEVFYIINDKPVSREEYLRHLGRTASKK